MNVTTTHRRGLTVTLVAGMLATSAQAQATKVLHFPPDQYMGHLSVEDPCLGTEYMESGRDLSYPFGFDPKRVCLAGDWDFVSTAQGDVTVLADRNLQLNVMMRLRQRDLAQTRAWPPLKSKILVQDRYRLDPDDLAGLSRLEPDDLHTLRVNSLVRTADADRRVVEPICRLTGLQVLGLYGTGITTQGMERLKALGDLRALELHDERISVQGLAVLKELPALEYFDMSPGATDAGLKHIAQARSLRWLRLSVGRIWGPGLAELAKLPHLERLSLWSDGGPRDRHIRFLEGLTQLKSLTLWGSNVPLTDASLHSIGKLTSMEELHFIRVSTEFTDAGVASLKGLKNLRTVGFGTSQIGAEGLRYLAELPNLEALSDVALNTESIRALTAFPNLKSLRIGTAMPPLNADVPREDISGLAALTSLEDLYLGGGRWVEEDLVFLESLRDLRRLTIVSREVTDRTMAWIGKLEHLEFLDLHMTGMTKRGLNQLNGLTNLRTLDVAMFSMDGAGIDETPLDLSALTQVRTLELSGFDLQDADLVSLAHMPLLEWVVLQNDAMTEEALVPLGNLAALKHLFISNLSCTTGQGLASLTGMQKASSFRLSGHITDGALNRLAEHPSLWGLTIETDQTIRPETVARLRERLPAIEYIHIDEPMRFDRPPVPAKQTPVRRSPSSVPRSQRRR
jgi:Leucine-rich repeat (LRR) protein